MGGRNYDKPRTILKGKSNYVIWVSVVKIELRAEEYMRGI
jgi:hypothetical protein